MEDTQQSGASVEASSSKCPKQLPRRCVLAILCNVAFFFRGLVVANISQIVFVKGFVAGNDIFSRMTNTTMIEMSNIATSYNWIIIFGQIPAAILVFTYSPRKTLIISIILSSFLQIITPWTLSKSLSAAVFNVIFQSICICPLDYACAELLSKWAPSAERNRLLMLAFTGRFAYYPLAYLLTVKLFTSVSPTFSYYFAGLVGAIWCILWYAVVKEDSPTTNKSNSECEDTKTRQLKCVPLKRILTSLPILSLCLVFACPALLYRSLMGLILFQNIPNMEFLGYLSLIINTIICIPVAGYLIDMLTNKNKLKNSTIRKVLCAGGLVLHVLFVMLHTIENDITSPLCFYVAFLIMDLSAAGMVPNFLELSSRYCTLIMGIAMTVVTGFSFLFDYISRMTEDTSMLEIEDFTPNLLLNQLPVLLTTVTCALLFAVFGSAEEQPLASSQPAIELQDNMENNSKIKFIDEAGTPENV